MKRSEFKYCLVKRLILRLDFKGLIESDIDSIVDIRSDFVKEGFRLEERVPSGSSLDATERMFEKSENKSIKSKQYVFLKDNCKLIVDKDALILSADIRENYLGADVFLGPFIKIASFLSERYKDIIRFTRIGFRKINYVFISELSLIPEYFNEAFFNIGAVVDNLKGLSDAIDLTISNGRQSFELKNSKINIGTEIIKGEKHNMVDNSKSTLYRVTFDIDAYSDAEIGEEIDRILFNLNENIFNVYKNILNSKFAKKLTEDMFEDDNIDGVVRVD